MTKLRESKLSKFRSLVAATLTIVALATVSFALVQADVAKNPHFDVYDEAAHFDYVLKLREGSVPEWGSKYHQETMRIAECLGSVFTKPGDCSPNKNRVPENFAPKGYSYEAQQPPLGYLPFLAFVQVGKPALVELNELRTSSSAFWLALTALCLFGLAAMANMRTLNIAFLAFIIFVNPTFVHAIGTINNDAAIVPAVLAWLFIEAWIVRYKPRRKFLIRFFAGAFLGLVKGFLVLIPISIAAASLVVHFSRKRKDVVPSGQISKSFNSSLPVFLGALASFGVFLIIQNARALERSSVVLDALLGFAKTDFPKAETFVSSLANMMVMFEGSYVQGITDLAIAKVIWAVLLVVLTVRVYKELARQINRPFASEDNGVFEVSSLSAAILLAITSLAWPILVYLQGSFDFPAPTRYALMALPLLALWLAKGDKEATFDFADSKTPEFRSGTRETGGR
jgi:hypothetical protein